MAFLCIDIGTSSCRAALVSPDGLIDALVRHATPLVRDGARAVELNCDAAWEIVLRCVVQLRAAHPHTAIDAIGCSAILGYVSLDRHHHPLGPAMLYADTRASAQVHEIMRRVPTERLHRVTGRRAAPELLAPKLLWLRAHQPDHYRRVETVIGVKDEMVRRLTGTLATDVAHANYSLLFDVAKGAFDRDLARDLGLDARRFMPSPATHDTIVGTLCQAAASAMGINAGIPVVAGSSDGTAAMYGGGLHQKNTAVLVSGTTDVLMITARNVPRDPSHSLSINTGPDADTVLIGGATGTAGAALQHYEALLNRSFASMAEDIAAIEPGADGLLALPGLAGERAPYWLSDASGALCGITTAHTPQHLFKALIEGIGMRMRRLLATLAQVGATVESVRVVGGMGGVPLINQIRSDVTGVVMQEMAQLEATCLGTAMFCASALDGGGRILDVSRTWTQTAASFAPDLEKTAVYDRLLTRFEACLHAMTHIARDHRAGGRNGCSQKRDD